LNGAKSAVRGNCFENAKNKEIPCPSPVNENFFLYQHPLVRGGGRSRSYSIAFIIGKCQKMSTFFSILTYTEIKETMNSN
jgi:hypothetical protein